MNPVTAVANLLRPGSGITPTRLTFCDTTTVRTSGWAASQISASRSNLLLRIREQREERRMSLADELAFTTVVELAGRIRRRELSPVEVLDATIDRIEARNPSLNALVYLGFDDARAAARDAERALTSGSPVGLLHGVPAAIKDLFDF